MRYFAQYNDENNLIAIGTALDGVEITKEEYNELLTMIREKASLVDQLYAGEITLDSIRADWQEEIQRRVNERLEWEKLAQEQNETIE